MGARSARRSCASQGDIQSIDAIPDDAQGRLQDVSFQLSPYAFLEVAARAQKWIDQAISRNMYLETRDLGDMMDIYYAAWERGVKTTYYLHMKPRHTGRAVHGEGQQDREDQRDRLRDGSPRELRLHVGTRQARLRWIRRQEGRRRCCS